MSDITTFKFVQIGLRKYLSFDIDFGESLVASHTYSAIIKCTRTLYTDSLVGFGNVYDTTQGGSTYSESVGNGTISYPNSKTTSTCRNMQPTVTMGSKSTTMNGPNIAYFPPTIESPIMGGWVAVIHNTYDDTYFLYGLMNGQFGDPAIPTIWDENGVLMIKWMIPDTFEARIQLFSRPDVEFAIACNEQIHDSVLMPDDDPFQGAGTSTTGGGGGTFDSSGDDIPVPSLPTLSASDAGFITLFNPSISQLNNLADYMWTDAAFDIANFKKIFEDPMDCILGLSIVPIAVTTSGSADVAIGNMLISSIQFPVVASQYQEFNAGTITIPNFFGGYLDYEPYTKIQIVVPFCGTFQISADDVIGKTIQLVYHIDVLTGSCVAMLLCGTSVLYQFNGSCAVNIPINSINYASTIENATRIAVAIGTTVATAGAAAPAMMAGGEAAGTATATLTNSAINTAGVTAEGALSMKPSIERSGALSSSSGMMSVQTPYIVITRPRLCRPRSQDYFKGYPSFIECKISDLEGKGYTEFDTIVLEQLYLTDKEKSELAQILRGGVYL